MQFPRTYSFGPHLLIPERQLLMRNEVPIRIGCRAFDLLTALVERPGELVTRGELISRVWPCTIVDDTNLKVNMSSLRRALDDNAGCNARYIATVNGRGYRFIASVQAGGAVGLALGPSLGRRKHNLLAVERANGILEAFRPSDADAPTVAEICRRLDALALSIEALRPAGEWGAAYGRVIDDLRAALIRTGRDAANGSLSIRLTVAGFLLWNHFSLTEEFRVHVSRAIDALDAAGLAGTSTPGAHA